MRIDIDAMNILSEGSTSGTDPSGGVGHVANNDNG